MMCPAVGGSCDLDGDRVAGVLQQMDGIGQRLASQTDSVDC